ncbi:MAG TPA: orotate phosphoribosyltransferase [Fimbriimonadaceae bacterium]|nr:orotate phosphoribosyltransferase [Fimbriimonadaceae bacterium]HRJ97477.1 orotate phosphoribosyltransferase [Fimbriimonadaceae bacterium]
MKDELVDYLEERGAILRGHFVLTSGRHSDTYVEKFRILEQPQVLSAVCARIADRFRAASIDVVAGPTTGGIIIAFEVARQLGCDAVYVETEDGRRTLRRGARVDPGARVLVVDDVLTTGRSLLETIGALCVEPAGIAVLIDRSEANPFENQEYFAACRVEAASFAADAVPEQLAAIPAIKPGTRLF